MLQQSSAGNMDWVNLAAKMFMDKLNQPSTQKQHVKKKTVMLPPPSTQRTQSPSFRARIRFPDAPTPTHLPPDCVATIKQFEALRVQLLRQLVLYQTQLLAMKMPPIPCQATGPVLKATSSKRKNAQHGSKNVKKQITSNKEKSLQSNKIKKWEKDQFPIHTLKNSNKRQSHVFQKPRKSSKKASKRRLDVKKSESINDLDNNLSKTTKRQCHPYQTCQRNYSSSTDSFYSTKHLKHNNILDSILQKGTDHQHCGFITCSSGNDVNNNTSVLKVQNRKATKVNKKISSAFAFDTATDEAQSSL